MRFQIFEYKNFMGTAAYADENISKGTIVYAILEGDVVCLNKDKIKGIRTSGEYFIPLFKSFSQDFPWVLKFNNTLGMQKSILRKEMCGFSLDHLETNLLLRRVPGKDHRVTIIYQATRQINKYELFVAEDEDRKTIGY